MAASIWTLYNVFKLALFQGLVDLDTSPIKMALMTSSYTPSLTDTTFASISANEIASTFGYTAGGALLNNKVSSVYDTTGAKFSSDPVSWIATGGSIVARYAVLYNSADDGLIARSLLDTTPADITVADGTALVITPSAYGYIRTP
jgi:hypothetical protein